MNYDINITDKKKPGGFTGVESFTVEDTDGKIWKATLQEITDVTPTSPFSLTDGSGSTANGTAVDLGGTMSGNIALLNQAGFDFTIGNLFNNNIIRLNNDSFSTNFESGNLNGFISHDADTIDMFAGDSVTNFSGEIAINASATIGDILLDVRDGSNDALSLRLHTTNGIVFTDAIGLGLFMADLKSGANQGAAGAAANEIWVDTADQTLKRGV